VLGQETGTINLVIASETWRSAFGLDKWRPSVKSRAL